MNRNFTRTRPASGVPAFVLATVVVAGSAAAQDGPVMLTGLPLGAIDTGAQNGPVLEAALPAGTSTAQATPTPQGGGVSLDVDVVAKQLDIAAQNIQPSLGASVYNFGRQAIETQPQGDNQPFNRLLLQAPGVAQDLFGQLHVRGDHANLQFRLNGVILPEGINVFGQALQTRLANSVSLITGALPAQFGLRTAGIIDIQTKTGTLAPGGTFTFMAGSSRRFSRVPNGAARSAKSTITSPAKSCTTQTGSRTLRRPSMRSTTSRPSRAASPMSRASSTRRRAWSRSFGISRSEYPDPE